MEAPIGRAEQGNWKSRAHGRVGAQFVYVQIAPSGIKEGIYPPTAAINLECNGTSG
jgi:hypothetical protein